jgi:copper resistance protein C
MKAIPYQWAALLIALLIPVCANAHAFLDHAEPRVGSHVSPAPLQVKIWFTDHLDPAGSNIRVADATGKQVDRGDVQIDPNDTTIMSVSLTALPPGQYTVTWHARCPQGHNTRGTFTFNVETN